MVKYYWCLLYKEVIIIARKRVSVTNETKTGRNQKFKDNYTGDNMSRKEFVNKIESGEYKNYHIRKINNIKTPVSNPDKNTNNNLD